MLRPYSGIRQLGGPINDQRVLTTPKKHCSVGDRAVVEKPGFCYDFRIRTEIVKETRFLAFSRSVGDRAVVEKPGFCYDFRIRTEIVKETRFLAFSRSVGDRVVVEKPGF